MINPVIYEYKNHAIELEIIHAGGHWFNQWTVYRRTKTGEPVKIATGFKFYNSCVKYIDGAPICEPLENSIRVFKGAGA